MVDHKPRYHHKGWADLTGGKPRTVCCGITPQTPSISQRAHLIAEIEITIEGDAARREVEIVRVTGDGVPATGLPERNRPVVEATAQCDGEREQGRGAKDHRRYAVS